MCFKASEIAQMYRKEAPLMLPLGEALRNMQLEELRHKVGKVKPPKLPKPQPKK